MVLSSANNNKKSNKRFWRKINNNTKSAGRKLLIVSLKMHYSFKDKDTPIMDKIKIFGAMLYFISPIDLILDPIPLIGYTDDLYILTISLGSVFQNIKKEHEYLAKKYVEELFNKS